MFKTFFYVLKRKMSSERKIKESLAEKLTGKKVPMKLDRKTNVAASKSQFFKAINDKSETKNRKKQKYVENIEEFNSENAEQSESDVTKQASISHPQVKRSSQRVKNALSLVDVKPNTESKSLKVNTNSSKTTTSTKEEDVPSTSKKVKHELSKENWQPVDWEIMLENIRRMRSNDKAPVDTMGCHKCADGNADEKTQRYQKLVALMLSSQTKDETTYHAMLRLREHNLTPEVISNMKSNVLENILHPVSFYKNKAKYMQQTSKILVERYNSDIPNNIKELVALPGVGPKMAHICMATAWSEVTGIGVDVHVHRISNRIGWLPKPTKEPEKTRVALESWLPQHMWAEVNHLLVGFGQTTCTPLKPKCTDCLNAPICPFAAKTKKK